MMKKVDVKKVDLKKKIESIKWVTINKNEHIRKLLNREEITVRFYKNPANQAITLYVRLGTEAMKKANLKIGDKVLVMYDPDDKMSLLITKCETGAGNSLSKESKSENARLQINWRLPFPENFDKQKIMDYVIHNKCIYFKIDA